MNIKGILEKVKSYGHVPVALFVFLVTWATTVFTKRDLGPQFVNSIYAMYGFLAGHAWVGRKYGDSDIPDTNTPDPNPKA
jgi:hypothetical protein